MPRVLDNMWQTSICSCTCRARKLSQQMQCTSQAPHRLPRRSRGFGVSSGEEVTAVISVRIAYDNLVVDLDFDSEQYSPDLVDDMTTLRAMWEMPKAGAGQ